MKKNCPVRIAGIVLLVLTLVYFSPQLVNAQPTEVTITVEKGDDEEFCDIAVTKEANVDNQNFPFNISGGEFDENFELANGDLEGFVGLPLSTTITITEFIPDGFTLEEIICEGDAEFSATNNSDSTEITCNTSGGVTCTFVNVGLLRNIPTLSEWGLIAMAALLGIAGFMVMRRRKVAM